MKGKRLIVIFIVLVLVMLKLIFNIITNYIIISQYNNGQYLEKQSKLLTYINFQQRYVENYNYGNIWYKNEKYEEAIEQYKKALNYRVPKYKECKIRINYALAICKTVELNEADSKSIEDAIKKYENAIDILTQNYCANKNDNNGHSQEAEQLKKDIKKEIERLKKLQKDNNKSQDNKKDENNTKNEENNTIENQIKKEKEEAIKEQREKENKFRKYNNEYNYDKKNW